MSQIGKLMISQMTDGFESKGFMLLVSCNVRKELGTAQALLTDGVDTVFATDTKIRDINHTYPEGNGKTVVYVKLAKKDEKYFVENIIPANDPILGGSCAYSVMDFLEKEEEPEEKRAKTLADLLPGEKQELVLLVTAAALRKGSAKPYLEIGLTDGKTTINAKDFTSKIEAYTVGKVIQADIRLDRYGYSVEKFSVTDKDPSPFIKHPPVAEADMYEEIVETLQELAERKGENSIAYMGLSLYEKYKDKLMYWSASKSMHHDLAGGLLYHTYRMMALAGKYLETYPLLNEELLLTATAIHDLGKLFELDTDVLGTATYTNIGNLLGHTVLCIEMIDRVSSERAYDPEMVMLLKHCIGSHHGKLEYNAVVLPKIMEAFVLHVIDYTDSRIYMFENAYRSIAAGKSADKRDIGLEAVLYRPTFTDDLD